MKQIKFFILMCIGVWQFTAHGQVDSTWIKTYGGNRVDKAYDIISTNDNGYMIIGTTSSFGLDNAQMYFLKLDSAGNIEWSKNHGGLNQEWGHSVIQTDDGGYLGVGYTNSYGNGGFDAYIVRLNSDGEYVYQRTYGGYHWDFVYDVVQVSTGVYAMVGETKSMGNGNSDAWIFQFNEINDSFEWQTTVGDSLNDNFKSVILNYNNELVAAGGGFLNGNNHQDIIISKTSTSGQHISTWNYGDTLTDFANDIVQLADSGYAFTGLYSLPNSNPGIASFKCNQLGNLAYYISLNLYPYGEGVKIINVSDTSTFILGAIEITGTNIDFVTIKTNRVTGSFESGLTYGTPDAEIPSSMTYDHDGLSLIGFSQGYSSSDFEDILFYKGDSLGVIYQNDHIHINDSANITSAKKRTSKPINFYQNSDFIFWDFARSLEMEILESSGRVICRKSNCYSPYPISYLNLAKGLYFLKLSIKGQVIVTNPIIIN